jgi:hypothetical protein
MGERPVSIRGAFAIMHPSAAPVPGTPPFAGSSVANPSSLPAHSVGIG